MKLFHWLGREASAVKLTAPVPNRIAFELRGYARDAFAHNCNETGIAFSGAAQEIERLQAIVDKHELEKECDCGDLSG